MPFYIFNAQVGNPNATYPPSLVVKSSAYGVTVLTLAPTHKFVAFNAATGPIPSGGYTADSTLYTADSTIITADAT